MAEEHEICALREGDVVLVRGVVGKPDRPRHPGGNVGIVFNHAGAGVTTHYVQASAIVKVEPRPIRAGDTVRMANRENGVVLFVGEETATLLSHLEFTPTKDTPQ